jgi:hypothetical protein
MAMMLKQGYRCQVFYGHAEVSTASGLISHEFGRPCLPNEKARLGLQNEPQSCLPSGQ